MASAIGWRSVIIPYGELDINFNGSAIKNRLREIKKRPIISRINTMRLTHFILFAS
jgi:hypothetical protein